MRLPRTLFLYVGREIIVYGVLAFLAVSAVLVSHNLLRRLDDLMMAGFTPADVQVVLRCLLPMLAAYAAPLAFLVGAVLAIRRSVSDGEFLAMHACGVGLRALLVPTLALATAVALLTGYLLVSVEHVARRDLLTLFKTIAARGGMFEPGRFANLRFGTFFVESRDRKGGLRGIVISDGRNPDRPYRIFAETGTFRFDEANDVIKLELRNGDLHLEPEPDDPDLYKRMHFERFEYAVDVSLHLAGARAASRPKQMTLSELRETLARSERGDPLRELDEKNPMEYALEIHRRYAMPFAPLLFGMLVVPLALTDSRRATHAGTILCGFMVFAYYALFSLGQLAARELGTPPWLSLWIPNLLLFGTGCALLRNLWRKAPR